MLDDDSQEHLMRPLFAVLGKEFFVACHSKRGSPKKVFTHSICYNLRIIQELNRRSGIWKLIFAYTHEDELVIYEKLQSSFGVNFEATVSAQYAGLDILRDTIRSADLVYAPSVCQQSGLQPKFQPPFDERVAVSIITYFSVSLVPFSYESYKAVLSSYDPSIDLCSAQGQSA